MKEQYYTTDNLDSRAVEFLDSLPAVLRKKPPAALDKTASALLVLDMQRYFLETDSHAYIPSGPAIIPKINRLQEAFLQEDRPVIQTRHLNTTENAGQMKNWWRDLISEDNPRSEISDSVRDRRVLQLVKHRYDAFFETSLEKALRENSVRHVVITGVMTHLCCETTARSAFMRGFDVFFVVDATATYNRQFHLASLLNLAHGFAHPFLTGDILAALEGGYG